MTRGRLVVIRDEKRWRIAWLPSVHPLSSLLPVTSPPPWAYVSFYFLKIQPRPLLNVSNLVLDGTGRLPPSLLAFGTDSPPSRSLDIRAIQLVDLNSRKVFGMVIGCSDVCGGRCMADV